jgi:NADH-quinone oxidoreductase subunit N
MTVFMFALLGFPVLGGAGFLAKWFVLKAALQAEQPQIALAVVLVLTTVISAGYYLYVVMVMFMRPRAVDAPPVGRTQPWTRFVVVACALAILIIGIAPDYTVRYASVGVPRLGVPADSALAAPPAPERAAVLR